MSTSPGVTIRLLTDMVWRTSAVGNEGPTATILPPAIPISMTPRNPAAGSSTSPPASRRSYFIVPSFSVGFFHPLRSGRGRQLNPAERLYQSGVKRSVKARSQVTGSTDAMAISTSLPQFSFEKPPPGISRARMGSLWSRSMNRFLGPRLNGSRRETDLSFPTSIAISR